MKIFGNTVTVQGEKLSISGGILKGALNMAGHILNGITAPTEDDHAANKAYADYVADHEASEALKESKKYAKEYADGLSHKVSVELVADKWNGDKSPFTQTVNAEHVTPDNAVVVAPEESSRKMYIEAEVHCSAQADESLTFECEEKPTAALTVNVLTVE
jgi:hypothetical protein